MKSWAYFQGRAVEHQRWQRLDTILSLWRELRLLRDEDWNTPAYLELVRQIRAEADAYQREQHVRRAA